jgi:UDP-N-acetylglucosamine 2-epimerase (non-hydrolysing)
MKKKILLVFGTRPEAIKMAPLVKALQERMEKFEPIVCVTAQHREMLDQVLKLFEITPQYDLNIMKDGQDLYDITSRVLLGMRTVLKDSQPDLVLVHGDTSTSTAAALASFYQQIPVGHVEAGLRTYEKYSPWPEEINRQMTSRIATFHFAPTEQNRQNLIKEGIDSCNIFVTGNTVIDALKWVIKRIESSDDIKKFIINHLDGEGISKENSQKWIKNSRKLVLITGHRRENFGSGFLNICLAIKELAIKYPEVDFIYPMHLNPNVRKPISEVFSKMEGTGVNSFENIFFCEPLDYLPFIYLMNLSYLVLTDSGGIQEEAPGLGKPVLVMRDTTERQEAVDSGIVKLVGTNKDLIIKGVSELLDDRNFYLKMANANNPFGDGKTCERIIFKICSEID